MWISKKTYETALYNASLISSERLVEVQEDIDLLSDTIDRILIKSFATVASVTDLWETIASMEKEIKKLKKQVKNGY
jgi:uncharacterized small protein (DUF1192 family)